MGLSRMYRNGLRGQDEGLVLESCVIRPFSHQWGRESERDSNEFRSKEWRDKQKGNIGFHLFFRQGPTVVWLELFPFSPWSPSPISPLPSPLLVSTPVQGLAKKPWGSISSRPIISLRPSLLREDSSIPPWSRLPVLLHFFTAPPGYTRELGDSSDVSDKLLSVSDKCSLLPAWLEPQPPIDDPIPMPRSSSEGSIESSRVYPGLVLPRPLLWLRWWPLVARRVKPDDGLGLGLRVWTGEEMEVVSSGRGRGHISGNGADDSGKSKFWGGDTLKLSPSSKVVWRLPSELPVARDESLWEGYWGR